mmetsp:Transcript_21613/g.35483  ORF Transcript_21613/g.35483 Transcript_21613/m.35483 type:complete len:258 (-) Transcript_21613:202-975(-)
MMNSHPQVENYFEIINKHRMVHIARQKVNSEMIQRFMSNTSDTTARYDTHSKWEEMLDVCFEKPANPRVKAVGFKWHLFQMPKHLDQVMNYLNKNDVKVIVLHRENYLRQAISAYFKNVVRTKYNFRDTEKAPKMIAQDISVEFFEKYLKLYKAEAKVLENVAATAKYSHFVVYEEIVKHPLKHLKAIEMFFGVDEHVDEVLSDTNGFQKLHQGPIESMVTNWQQKKEILLKGEFKDSILKWDTTDDSTTSTGITRL